MVFNVAKIASARASSTKSLRVAGPFSLGDSSFDICLPSISCYLSCPTSIFSSHSDLSLIVISKILFCHQWKWWSNLLERWCTVHGSLFCRRQPSSNHAGNPAFCISYMFGFISKKESLKIAIIFRATKTFSEQCLIFFKMASRFMW